MKDFLDDLLVVLVIYQTKIAESPAYHSLTEALQKKNYGTSLFVYDNSPLAQVVPGDITWSAEYFHDPHNPGVSKAYNEGHRRAKSKNKKWMLLVDQDTLFPLNCIDEYFKATASNSIVVPTLRDNSGIVSPLQFYRGGGQRPKNFERKSIVDLNDFLFHNSGLLISTDTFEQAGTYDENLRLDFSDFAFVYRLRVHNKEFALADFSCSHRLASADVASMEERLLRFRSYKEAGRYFKNKYAPHDWLLVPRIFLRGVKLSLHYRTYKFITPFLWRE